MADNRVQGINVAEAKLEEKRMALRRALKREYLRQAFDPQAYPSGRRVFDTAMYRFAALQNSSANYVVQNARNFFMYLGVFWVPVGIVSVYYYNRRLDFEKRCRDGKEPIDSSQRRMLWNQ